MKITNQKELDSLLKTINKSNTIVLNEDLKIMFDCKIPANIEARNITVKKISNDTCEIDANIEVKSLKAEKIEARDITAEKIDANIIHAYNIKARDITAKKILAFSMENMGSNEKKTVKVKADIIKVGTIYFNGYVEAKIIASNTIDISYIIAENLTAHSIKSNSIEVENINANNISTDYLTTKNINVYSILAKSIYETKNVFAKRIRTKSIEAENVEVGQLFALEEKITNLS